MPTLDIQINQALMRWRLIERALHGHGTWLMTYNGTQVPVSRFIREGCVSLVAHFPPLCLIDPPKLEITLTYDGEVMRVIPIDEPLDEDGCQVWIDMVVGQPVSA